VGVRQLFVRVRGCDLACRYCDQPQARHSEGPCRIERPPASGNFTDAANPFTAADCFAVLKELDEVSEARHHSVALTGGEPLLYPGFVAALGSYLHDAGRRLYLETAGHRPQQLAEVIHVVDWVAMDIKLPSTLPQPIPPEVFGRSLAICEQCNAMVKMVITGDVTASEVEAVCQGVRASYSNVTGTRISVPLVLQPVTPVVGGVRPAPARLMLQLQALCQRYFEDVRIIPQCHRLVGLL